MMGKVYPRPRGGARSAVESRMEPYKRSIPAHAGEPRREAPPKEMRRTRVYPRPRGGAAILDNRRLTLQRRSIPAHAGEPELALHAPICRGRSRGLSPPTRGSRVEQCPRRSLCTIWVYPRPRGGAACERDSDTASSGLSPPTRGSPSGSRCAAICPGSIPAHAGEPTPSRVQP